MLSHLVQCVAQRVTARKICRPHPYCLGTAGRLLLRNSIYTVGRGERVPIVGLPEATQLTYRAGVDGFWIALRMTTEPEPIELWHVGFDGSAARLGRSGSPW